VRRVSPKEDKPNNEILKSDNVKTSKKLSQQDVKKTTNDEQAK